MKKATARKNAIRSSIAMANRAVYWFSATTTSAISAMIRNPLSVGRSARNLRTVLGGQVGAKCKHGCQQRSPGQPRQPAPWIRRRVDPGPGHCEHREASIHVMHPFVGVAMVGQQ